MNPVLRRLGMRLRNCSGARVDSNVLLDISSGDSRWAAWSSSALSECAEHAVLIVNPIVYADVSVRYSKIEALEAAIPQEVYRREALPREAAFLAGKVFVAYRRRGGLRTTPLPDFYIGAHASAAGLVVLTRDAAPYRTYFPKVELLAPSRPN